MIVFLKAFSSHGLTVIVRRYNISIIFQSSGTMMKPGAMCGMALRIDCDQCTFTATSSQQMIKHKQNRHEGLTKKVGKLRCPFCDYRNSYQKVMDLHIKAHEGRPVKNRHLELICVYNQCKTDV